MAARATAKPMPDVPPTITTSLFSKLMAFPSSITAWEPIITGERGKAQFERRRHGGLLWFVFNDFDAAVARAHIAGGGRRGTAYQSRATEPGDVATRPG